MKWIFKWTVDRTLLYLRSTTTLIDSVVLFLLKKQFKHLKNNFLVWILLHHGLSVMFPLGDLRSCNLNHRKYAHSISCFYIHNSTANHKVDNIISKEIESTNFEGFPNNHACYFHNMILGISKLTSPSPLNLDSFGNMRIKKAMWSIDLIGVYKSKGFDSNQNILNYN